MSRQHRVPLSAAALEIFASPPREDGNEHVFIGPHKGRGLSSAAMAAVLDRMGRKETVHGFRAGFKTWCSEATSFPPHLVEAALAHINRDKVEAAYARGDLFKKRTKIMEAWASFCTSPQPAANVVPLPRKAKATA